VSHFNTTSYGWQATVECQKIAAFGSSCARSAYLYRSCRRLRSLTNP